MHLREGSMKDLWHDKMVMSGCSSTRSLKEAQQEVCVDNGTGKMVYL